MNHAPGPLALFRLGPLSSSEFTEAMDRHQVPPATAGAVLGHLLGRGLLDSVDGDGEVVTGTSVHRLTGPGRQALAAAVSGAAAGWSSGTDHAELLLCRPDSAPHSDEGEPLPVAVGTPGRWQIQPTMWPQEDLPQHTPTAGLRSRRTDSWWPWTVPDPCCCLWARRAPGASWEPLAQDGFSPCPPPAHGLDDQPAGAVATDGPLVSCIMPTADRRALVARAIGYFLDQRYARTELVIVDDGEEPVADIVPDRPDVRYLRLPARTSIGAKMNSGCELARGEIIAQWDDDDWHGPDRIARQVAPLLSGSATITAFDGAPFYHLATGRTWSAPNSLVRQLRMNGMIGGTLVYLREEWIRSGGYPDLSFFEQTTYLDRVLAAGGKLATVPNNRDFVVIRHGANTWHDRVLGIAGWTPTDGMPWLPRESLEFYRTMR